jgi:choline-sulfatase
MTHPHDPYVVPQAYWDRYCDADVDMPAVTQEAVADDPHSRRIRHVIGLGQQQPSAAQVRAARRAYLGAVSYVDDQVGTLLATLKDARLAENTIVMVLADHGDMLGERGLWYKMSFFEPACRIPLIVSARGRFSPSRVNAPASLLDILPTLVELGSGGRTVDYAALLDGHSLVPLLEGGKREAVAGTVAAAGEVVGEYLAEAAIAPVVMIRRENLKFVHSPVDPDQLYDLAADPQERVNLAAGGEHAAVVAAFRSEVPRRWSLPALHAEVLASQRRRHLVYAALRSGRYTPWDFQPLRDASRLYVRNDQELNDIEAMARFPRLP